MSHAAPLPAPRLARIAIVNRGEPALRLVTAVRELPPGGRPATIALLTAPDLDGPVARAADEVVVLPVPQGASATAAYLDLDRVMAALDEARADAVWVGWGFLAESPDFCARVEASGRTFIGPTPATLALTGDKVAAKRLAESVGAPVVPWSAGLVATLDDAHAHAARIGYPVIVKAAAGGGGRGIRVAATPADLPDAFDAASTEALRAFGDGRVFLEACVGAARHLEVQIAGDGRGHVLALGVRDCTTQRRHQKVVEECPGPFTTPALRAALEAHALHIAKALDYRSLGTFEFIADVDSASPRHGEVYFMEVNPRLQVEHTVTEEVFGLDLVKLQLHLAAGGDLPAVAPEPRGAAVQVRLCAEDPERGDVPAPGRIAAFAPARGPGVRVDSALAPGVTVTADFDSMIAKVIARGADRAEAIARVQSALGETVCLVEDGATNKGLLLDVLAHPDFAAGAIDTRWLDRVRREGRLRPVDLATEALVVAGLLSYRALRRRDDDAFHDALAHGYPQRVPPSAGHTFQLGVRGQRHPVHVLEVGADRFRARLAGLGEVACEADPELTRVRFGDVTRRVRHHVGPRAIVVELDDRAFTIDRDAGGVLRAPAPALVIAVLVAVGDVVAPGQRLATLESMKLEMPLRATTGGRVVKVFTHPNATLAKDDPIVAIEPATDAPAADLPAADLPPPPLTLDPLSLLFDPAGHPSELAVRALNPAGVAAVHAAIVAETDALLLGWDLDPERAERLVRLLAHADLWDAPLFVHRPRELVDRIVTYADLEWLLSDRELRGVLDAPVVSMETAFYVWARHFSEGAEAVRPDYRVYAVRAAQAYGRFGPDPLAPDPALRALLVRMASAAARTGPRATLVARLLVALLQLAAHLAAIAPLRGDRRLERALMQIRGLGDDARLAVADEAAETHHVVYQRPRFAERQHELGWLLPGDVPRLVAAPVGLMSPLCRAAVERRGPGRLVAAEAFLRRLHNHRELAVVRAEEHDHLLLLRADELVVVFAPPTMLEAGLRLLARSRSAGPCELATWVDRDGPPVDALVAAFRAAATAPGAFAVAPARVTLLIGSDSCSTRAATLVPDPTAPSRAVVPSGVPALVPDVAARDLHPEVALRLGLARLEHFDLERQPSGEGVFAWLARARANPEDERLIVYIEVKDVYAGGALEPAPPCLHSLEHALRESMSALRRIQSLRGRERLHANEITLVVRPAIALARDKILELVDQMPVDFKALGLDRFMLRGRWAEPGGAAPRLTEVVVTNPSGHQLEVRLAGGAHPVHVASAYDLKVRRARRHDVPYPYELVRLLTSDPSADTPERLAFPRGSFEEWDIVVAPDGRTVAAPVARLPGLNTSAVVFGLVTHHTDKHPEGMTRVLVLSDPLRGMGALAEPECRRLVAAFDLAAARHLPLEWVPVSSGAKIAMDTGTENLDWTARVLRRIIEFTAMRGTPNAGVVHVVVDGVNVGAQSYFDAEAALLLHTRGALIMTRRGAMVLTGKKALDFSGGVSAADERGIGGWERIMGPNGEAHYFAHDLAHAFRLLLQIHDVAYVQPGERHPRRRPSADPATRDAGLDPYPAQLEGGFATVGDIFSDQHNREKKRSFDIRTVMGAVVDRDGGRLERWAEMRDADTAVVWDSHIGGAPVTVIGFESRPLPRHGVVPGDGPAQWTAGTLFPLASKKVARALNAASGNRPVVVLANLSGFDGSPESMRRCQLEWGAEIGRAVVAFDGPILFYVIGRYHGGAYVVFSKALNERLYAAALEGTFASVIGGAPAAAVVFPREVRARTLADPRVAAARRAADEGAAAADLGERQRAADRYREVFERVHAEKLGDVAREFDEVHSVGRALAVGSLDAVVAPPELRAHLAATLARLVPSC